MTTFRIDGDRVIVDLVAAEPPVRVAVEQQREDWETVGWLSGNAVHLTFDEWYRAGQPTLPTDDPGDREYWRAAWASTHDLLCGLVGVTRHDIAFTLNGFFGAIGAAIQLVIDGRDQTESRPGFDAWRGDERLRPEAPLVTWTREHLRGFETRDRKAQLATWAGVRGALDSLAPLLSIPLSISMDPHLSEIRPETPEKFSLEWRTSGRAGQVATLTTHIVNPDGTRRPLPYEDFDPRGFVVTDPRRPVLLPAEVATVIEAARRRDRKSRRDVEREMVDPTLVIPEGIDADRYFDLSLYSPRVAGFEVVEPKPREFNSSGVRWFDSSAELRDAFLRLFGVDARTGKERELEIESREAAEQLFDENERALRIGSPQLEAIELRPSDALRRQLESALKVARPHDVDSDVARDRPRPVGTEAAIVRDLPASAADLDGPVIDEGRVPWDVLTHALLPEVTLKPHQRRGIAWLWQHVQDGTPGVVLADDMGLGKTLQAAALLALRVAIKPSAHHIIVCPTVLIDNWLNEIEMFFQPDVFHPFVLHGAQLRHLVRNGSFDLEPLREQQLLITNYETLAKHQKSLLKLDLDIVVLDEAQLIKNPETLRARAARALKRKFAIALSGTPVENVLTDIWAIYDAVQTEQPRAFATQAEFENRYTRRGPDGIADVRNRLQYPGSKSTLFRRDKAHALRDLPPKEIVVRRTAMTQEQAEMERLIAREAKRGNVLGALQSLRRLYQHPILLQGKDVALSADSAVALSPKTKLCLSILEEIRVKSEKALVFVLYRQMQDVLAELIQQQFGLPRVHIINGDPEKRIGAIRSIESFSTKVGFNVLVLSPIAAGLGLTITAANHVIHYDRWWNPAKEDQATDRAYRMGQNKPVTVYYPVLHRPGEPGAGFDVRLHELVERKRKVARDFLAPTADLELSGDEVASVLKEDGR